MHIYRPPRRPCPSLAADIAAGVMLLALVLVLVALFWALA